MDRSLISVDSIRLGGEVSKVFPDVLLAAMDIIYSQYKTLKGRDGYTFNTDENKERVTSNAVSIYGHLIVDSIYCSNCWRCGSKRKQSPIWLPLSHTECPATQTLD